MARSDDRSLAVGSNELPDVDQGLLDHVHGAMMIEGERDVGDATRAFMERSEQDEPLKLRPVRRYVGGPCKQLCQPRATLEQDLAFGSDMESEQGPAFDRSSKVTRGAHHE